MDMRYGNTGGVTEVIVKYTGNLRQAVEGIDATVEILSEDYAIVTLPVSSIEALYLLEETEYIEVPKRLYFSRFLSQRSACIYDEGVGSGLSGRGTLIGIIDSGIDIYNKDFIDDNGTRIVSIWDLSGQGQPPEGFSKGVEYTKEEIDASITGDSRINFSDLSGHGTAIAGIAAGNGRSSSYRGIAHEAELVVVKLGDRDGFVRSTDIMRGLRYIKGMAEMLNMPVAINISYGTNDGSHDGSSLFEGFINEIADNTRCLICVAAGNEGAAAHHYKGSFVDNEGVSFNVAGGIRNMYMSIWKNFSDDVGVIITAPSGMQSGIIRGNTETIHGGTRINAVFTKPAPYNTDVEIYINFAGDEVAPGIWSLEFVPYNIVYGEFDIWLPVLEAVGRDTAFLEPETDITITLPATAQKVLAVGGFNQLLETVAPFSGRGYTRKIVYVKPDIIAPAVNVPAPAPGGGVDSFTGTSFASPHAVGAAALAMEWGIVKGNDLFLYGERLKAYLIKGATRYDNVEYPSAVLGWGKLCFESTMRLLTSEQIGVTIQQNGKVSVAEAAYSEDFYDFVRRRNPIGGEIQESDDIAICNMDENFSVVYVRKEYYRLNRNEFSRRYGLKTPFIMGLMQYETALEASGITYVQNQPYLNLRGNGVIVAVIDTGINYRNDSFIYEDGTSKILYIWDQTKNGTRTDVCFGREYSNAEINSALRGETELDTEDSFGHGTYLAELAAGRNGAAPDADLIVVRLKGAKKSLREELFLDDDVPAFESADLMLGVSYARKKAVELGRPLVICIGTGTNQGGHNGQTVLEEYFTIIAASYGVCLCVPTGNEGIERHHSAVEFETYDSYKDVEITVSEGEEGLNIWLWNFVVNSVAIEIVSPLGERINRLQPVYGYSNSFILPKGGGTVKVEYYISGEAATDQFTSVRITRPAQGIWSLRLYNNNNSAGVVHLWLPLRGFIKEDTYFLSSDPSVTVTNPGTANAVMTVGGYNTFDNSFYAPSGRGPIRNGTIRPYFCAPAVNINGMSGTSFACAISAGAAALLMEWLIIKNEVYITNTISITSYLMLGARESGNELYPNNRWGYGMLDLQASFGGL